MAAEIHVDDIGTSFRVTMKDEDGVVVDISTATSLLIWFAKADGSTMEKTATLVNSGTDGLMEYVTVDGDLDQAGPWKIQGVVGFADDSVFHSDITKFKVFANLR